MSILVRVVCGAVAFAAASAFAGCGEPAPTAPGPERSVVEGTWSGTLDDQLRGAARVQFSVAGFGESARGRFTISFADSRDDLSGDVTISTFDRPRLELFFRASAARDCPAGEGPVLHARATLAATDRISGNYVDLIPCGPARRGTLEVTHR
jgi:hypothetical protein